MKKTLAILLALVMLFTLAACGEKNTNSTGSDNPDANGSPASSGSETTGAYADKTIGFCGMTLNNEYHVVVANAAKAEAKEQGVNILIQAGSEHASVDEQSNMGKLIYGDTWYYVVTLPEEQASYLKSQGAVTLRFAKGFDQNIRMQVVSVSAPEDGQAAVTLSCRKYLAQTTLLRHQAADVILRTYEGLRVPSNALRVSEEGVTGVYCVDGSTAAFRPVTVLYQGQGYALVRAADGASDTQTLRVGDEVIATAGALSDGKGIR